MRKYRMGIIFFISNLVALATNGVNNDFELFLQRRQEQQIDKVLEKELEQINEEEEKENILSKSSKHKFFIKKITLVGEKIPNLLKVNKLIDLNINKSLGLDEIKNLTHQLTNIYISKGYVGARVLIPTQQNLKDGVLKLVVVLGEIEAIKYRDNSEVDKLKVWWTFPTQRGDVLKLSEVEQGVTNLNRAPQNNATINILPGTEFGKSIIEVKNERKSYWHGLSFGYNNFGSESTGRDKINFSYGIGDMIGLNEVFSIYGSANIFDSYANKKDNNFGVDLVIPFKSWDIGVSYNQSKTLQTVAGNIQDLKFTGKTELTSYRLGKVLYSYPNGKVRWDSVLNLKNKENFVNKEKINVSSRKSASWKNSLSASGRVFNGAYYISASYQRGLLGFGTSENIPKENSRARYKKYTTYAKYIKPFTLGKNQFVYEFSNSTQFTNNKLYSDEKYTLGNELTVRGYQNSISGDKGYFFRNQLYYSLPGWFNGYRIYTGFDFGETGDKKSQFKTLKGGAIGIDYTTNHVSVDLSVGKSLKYIDSKDKKPVIYLSTNFFF